jgi:hypothetical protein
VTELACDDRVFDKVDRRSDREPVAGPPSPARVRAAIARISRAHANASSLIPSVFGDHVVDALRSRVTRLAAAVDDDIALRAESLHSLAVWLAAVAECVELESPAAAHLAADLAMIIRECELVATALPAIAAPSDVQTEVEAAAVLVVPASVVVPIATPAPAAARQSASSRERVDVADWLLEL